MSMEKWLHKQKTPKALSPGDVPCPQCGAAVVDRTTLPPDPPFADVFCPQCGLGLVVDVNPAAHMAKEE